MTKDQLRAAVARGRPASAEDLVAQDPAVQEASKARAVLEASGKTLKEQEKQVGAEVKTLKDNIDAFKGRHWFGRWWYGKKLAKLQTDIGQRRTEAYGLEKELKALARQLKAAAKVESQARQKARPGAEREAQRQQEHYEVLRVAYERRTERERPQQQAERERPQQQAERERPQQQAEQERPPQQRERGGMER